MLIMSSILTTILIAGCIKNTEEPLNNNELSNIDQPLFSPSGNYKAVIDRFEDNGVRAYKVEIVDVKDFDTYEVDILFRARDRNYVFWADEDDILWGYSGDVGTYFWLKENGFWIKKTYADNPNAVVPQALKDARPNKYN